MSTVMVSCPHCGGETNAESLRCKVCGERRAEMRVDPEGSGTVRTAEAPPDSRTDERGRDAASSNVVRFRSRRTAQRGSEPPFDGDPGPSAA